MKLLKPMLMTVLFAGGAGFLGACGGAVEPQATAVPSPAATATVQPKADPTKGEAQPATSTPLPAVKATPTAPKSIVAISRAAFGGAGFG